MVANIVEGSMILERKYQEEAEVVKVNTLRANLVLRGHTYRPMIV
jgi:hypothetical protein